MFYNEWLLQIGPGQGLYSNPMLLFLSHTVCEKDVLTVCTNSSHEHVHPFKEKMDVFIASGEICKDSWDSEKDLDSKFLSLLFMCSVTSANPSHLPCSDMKSSWSLRCPASLDDWWRGVQKFA